MGGTLLAQAVSLLAVPQNILKAGSIFWFRTTCRTCLSGRCVSCLGLFFDGLSLMIMTLPIVFPLLIGLNFEALPLGVIITILIEIGHAASGIKPFCLCLSHQGRSFTR